MTDSGIAYESINPSTLIANLPLSNRAIHCLSQFSGYWDWRESKKIELEYKRLVDILDVKEKHLRRLKNCGPTTTREITTFVRQWMEANEKPHVANANDSETVRLLTMQIVKLTADNRTLRTAQSRLAKRLQTLASSLLEEAK